MPAITVPRRPAGSGGGGGGVSARCGAGAARRGLSGVGEDVRPCFSGARGGELVRRWSRVGVQLVGWGFSKTDGLVADDGRRRDFKKLRDKASELFD